MSRHVTTMTIDDAEHYTPEQRQAIIDSYPDHERDARTKGVPIMGSGRVFPISEEKIVCDPFAIPSHWVQINGLDFGWDHPFGATNCAWDRDADIFYVCKEYAEREATPIIHSAAIRPWGGWIPCAWPHDGLQHDKGSGEALKAQYEDQGLAMLDDKATHAPALGEKEGSGGNGVEAGIMEMFDRMKTGRWKVFSTCGKWFAEFRLYHRLDGQIVKERDDVISSSRYALMMKRHAINKPSAQPIVLPSYGIV